MAERMDIICPRTVGDKTYFTKIGVAFSNDKGGWSLSFEALPIPQLRDGKLEVRALMMKPKSRDDAPAGKGKAPPADFSDVFGDDDKIPF